MKTFGRITERLAGIFRGTYGAWASAMFLVSLMSGILLAVHYDVADPYASIKGILLGNPWASLFRNIHFWSSQFFLVLTLIHFWGYLRPRFFKVTRVWVWIRLVLAVFILFMAMFTGFLLKGDADSTHARLIFSSLVEALPWLGEPLRYSLLGDEGEYLLPYVHHIATTTIILLIIVREHSRKLWTGTRIFLVGLVGVVLVSLFLSAPLHDGIDTVVKGPWYFLGIQELLHWLPAPALSWYFLLAFAALVFGLRYSGPVASQWIRRVLLLMAFSYIALTLVGIFFRGANWQWSLPGKGENTARYPWADWLPSGWGSTASFVPGQRMESCLVCHDGYTGFSPGHHPDSIGCASCHGGNMFSMSADVAHRGMRLVPGNLGDAGQSCSSTACHPDILPRLERSLMTSMSGIIAVDEWVFGEAPHPDVLRHVDDVGYSASGTHLRNLCLSCHLGRGKDRPGPVGEDSRGGGCLACHVSYGPGALASLARWESHGAADSLRRLVHPRIGLEIGNEHCFGCHSRSGRISTNYEGWHETLLDIDSVQGLAAYRIVQGARVFTRMPEDVHHKAGMLCIDCHSSWEVMGDGNHYAHEEDAVKVQCADCHRSPGEVEASPAPDYETRKILALRGLGIDQPMLLTREGRRALPATRVDSLGIPYFRSHVSGRNGALKAPASICTQGQAHDALDCNACHAAWAPRCIGCHTGYDPKRPGNDLYSGKATQGSWFELSGGFLAGPPTLGVTMDKHGGRIIRPVIPGMIMTLDQSGFGGHGKAGTFHRLFAPSSPHTTQAKGRSCESCHSDPLALGYGSGTLRYANGSFSFAPEYESLEDGLPADAWIGMDSESPGIQNPLQSATRSNLRPFSVAEQRRILAVGACLTCHPGDSRVMTESLEDFSAVVGKRSTKCDVPIWILNP